MMDHIIIDKYKNSWVLSSLRKVEEGIYLEAPPVRIIPHQDRDGLRAVLTELFAENVPVVPRPDFDDPQRLPGPRPSAFNLKKPNDYMKGLRVFNLQKTEGHLLIEEWQKEKRAFVAEPLWRKKFNLDDLDKLIEYLIEKTQ